MKVLVIHSAYKVKGGEDTVVYEEIKLLQSLGLTVNLLQFDNDKYALLKFIQLPFNISSYRKTKRKIKEFEPDIVHIHNLHFAGSASVIYAIKKSKIPFVTTLHNYRLLCPSAILYFNHKLFFNSLNQKFPWAAIKKGVYRNSVLLTFWMSLSTQVHKWLDTWKACSRFIVLSEDAKNIFLQAEGDISKEKIIVKPNFCTKSAIKISARDNYFLYVGRLSEEKGLLTLLNVFSDNNYPLKIAGNGPLKNEVISYSNRFSNIEYIGNLSKEEVFKQMQTCTALVFPSVWLEGMPLTIIEAFACGTPVISSQIGAMRYMISDKYNGLFFKPESENELSKKLSEWCAFSHDEKEVYRQNASKTYAKNYTPSFNAKQLINIYNQVLAD